MKKILTFLTVFLLLFSAFAIYANAERVYQTAEINNSDKLISLSVYSYPAKTVYGAFERLDTTGLKLRAVYEDGREELIQGDKIGIRYQQDVCFRVGDKGVVLSFGGKSITMPITVNRISYDLSILDLEAYSLIYNGSFQGYNKALPSIVGLDGIPLSITTSGGGTNVGSYDISINFETASSDYILPEAKVVPLIIEPASAEITWEELSFVYDGKSKVPKAYYVDVRGNKVYPEVIGAAINAGSGYTAKVIADDANYSFTNTQINYEIKKADYDFSGVSWSNDSFVYDGSIKSISATGLPLGVSIIGYTGDRGIDAGTYNVTAALRWDENNYNAPLPLTHTWEIQQAEYDISKIRFIPSSFVYDGKIHYPTLEEVMPIGADGIALEYRYSAGACHVSDGVVSVTITFTTNSKNYKVPSAVHSSVTVTPLAIEVVWGDSRLEYNGKSLVPTATSDKCTVNVTGAAISVGSYVAEAVTDNSDYEIKNSKISFTIIKAENKWVDKPTASVCYEGKEIGLSATSSFGEVKYRFYSDAEGKHQISAPTACGVYYAVAYVDETVNYTGLQSSVLSFEIVKIEAISFYAVIQRQNIKAFESLKPDDLVCTVINNDGSVISINPSEVKIVYENGDSFRKRDELVTLKYGKFTLQLAVSVEYADYDLSAVQWNGTSTVYDGTSKSPWLTGLPTGITVVEYVGGEITNAGDYTVFAKVDYDYENYNEPKLPSCKFVIEKCPLKAPEITSEYNGTAQIPMSDSSLYTLEFSGGFVDAGVYYISAQLYDSENYYFEGGSGGSCLATFVILPRTLSVTVFDVKKYLFEDPERAPYAITDGEIYNGDEVVFVQYVENNKVYLRSDNPNYVLSVTPGKIQKLPYATREGSIKIIVILVLISGIGVAMIYAYRKRDKISEGIEILRCRWANRNISVQPLADNLNSTGINTPIEKNEPTMPNEENEEAEDIDWHDESLSVNDVEIDDDVEETEEAIYDAPMFSVDVERADKLITDSLARNLVKKQSNTIYTEGSGREIINVDTLSENFDFGEKIDINLLKSKNLISKDTSYIKVLARGSIDKPLFVYANDFSLSAVKMIALTGGEAVKTITAKDSKKRKNI